MAKKLQTSKRLQEPEKQTKPLIPEKNQDLVFILILIASIFIFFASAIFGGGFNASDNIASASFKNFLAEAKNQGFFPLWNPYIFSGIPSFASMLCQGDRWWDFISKAFYELTVLFGNILGSDVARMSCFYCIYAIGMYYLMRSKNHLRIVAFFTSLAAVFSTGIVVWIMIGHNTKPMVFAMFPFILLFLEKLRVKFSILISALLILAIHIMMEAGHLQMIFYGACCFGLYVIFEIISSFIKKQGQVKTLVATGILVIAAASAFIMSSDRYLSALEYTPYSTRGSAPIIQKSNQSQDKTGGNDYNYATMWSFSPEEMVTFIIPNYFGFGRLEYKGSLSRNQAVLIPTYWGQKPMEDAAPYMGIIVLGLAFVGFIKYRKDIFIKFLFIISIFSLLLSFGYTFPVIYDFFYYYVPTFNKFRAPSMALAIMHFSIPIMAGYGLAAIIEWRSKASAKENKYLIYGIILASAFLFIGIIYSSMFQSSYMESLANSKSVGRYAEEIHKFIWEQMINDWYITALIALIASIMFYLFVKRKINRTAFFTILICLLIFDLWRVDYRRMELSDTSMEKEYFKKTDAIDFMKQDKSVFRIADFAAQSPNIPAYFLLENVNGYHAAKLRVYQDLLDVADKASTSEVTNPFLWNLMNVKYLIFSEPMQGIQPVFQSKEANQFIYVNTGMLPRAFFVKNYLVDTPINILKHLKEGDFNPTEISYLEEKIPEQVDSNIQGSSVKFIQKQTEYMKLQVNAVANNLLFLSEIYYPIGWTAYLDGKETKILKTNFAFRSLVIPAGNHTLELKFHSEKFEIGKNLSLIFNIGLSLLIITGLFIEYRTKKKRSN